MTINIKVVTTTEGMPQLRNAPQRSAAAFVIEGRPRARGHIDDCTTLITLRWKYPGQARVDSTYDSSEKHVILNWLTIHL